MSSAEPDSVAANVAQWTATNAEFIDGAAEEWWKKETVTWGVFGIADEWLGDVAGLDVVELGCGAAQCASRLARLGARVVGVDPTPAQLETARRMQRETGIEFPLVEAPGETVPLPDASFDLVVSEHGAAAWADPQRWLPEAHRLLRSGGRVVFLHTSPLAYCCFPDVGKITEQLQRPYFEVHEVVWPGDDGVEYQLTHAEWIALLRDTGFVVERLIELQATESAVTHEYYDDVPVEWARRWPEEEIWVARK
jgi:ubiquinone/menaquinone biosynthesis C-methylase UbiE